jgi:hypothetical protein
LKLARRTALGVAAVLASVILGPSSSAGPPGAAAAAGLSVRARAAPFALEVRNGAKPVTTFGGSVAPLGYWANGIRHAVTRLLGQTRSSGGTTYTAATDEPGRTVSVTVEQKQGVVRLTYAVEPSSAVNAVGFGLTAPASAHFLGTGERTCAARSCR